MTSSVLLVDDDPAFLSLAVRVLEGMGIEVVATAEDAETAIAAANATKPDAALVDVGLPDCTGIELASRLGALPWRPRVVLMSTDSDAVSDIQAHESGPEPAFVAKADLANGRLRALLSAP
jgi:CheY-like chemotaxis protein